MKRFRFKVFNDEWLCDLVYCSWDDFQKYIKTTRFKDEAIHKKCRGLAFMVSGLQPLIWICSDIPEERIPVTLVHEIVHISTFTCRELCIEDEEFQCHTVAFMLKQCYCQMKKWRVL